MSTDEKRASGSARNNKGGFLSFFRGGTRKLRLTADQLRDSRQFAEAADVYGQYLAHRPEDFGIWVQRGNCLKDSGALGAAELAYQQAIRLKPEDADVHLQMGHVLKLQGRLEDALISYEKCRELDPASGAAASELGGLGANFQPAKWRDLEAVRPNPERTEASAAASTEPTVSPPRASPDPNEHLYEWYFQSEPSGGNKLLAAATRGPLNAAWIADDWVLVVGGFVFASGVEVRLVKAGQPLSIEVRQFSCALENGSDAGPLTLLLLHLVPPVSDRQTLGTLVLETPTGPMNLGPVDLPLAVVDFRELIAKAALAALPAKTREALTDFVLSTLGRVGGRTLHENLVMLRAALRTRLPSIRIARDHPQGLAVDALLAIDDTGFYSMGWMHDSDAQITALTFVSPEGARVEVSDRLFHFRRPDIDELYKGRDYDLTRKAGWICYFELPYPSVIRQGWVAEMENALGVRFEAPVPEANADTDVVLPRILSDLTRGFQMEATLREQHIMPAVSRLMERRARRTGIERVVQFGEAPQRPDVSVVVPLYGRIDYLEHQLAQFVHDPEARQSDLIYVLDSPELSNALFDSAAQLAELYRVPFRIVFLRHNGGYSAANNAGVSVALGRRLVLLNSDVLPEKPGWIGEMTRFYDATPNIGALGPKLLYEDDSLQHAGMFFSKDPRTGGWWNEHYFKGLHRDLPGANVARQVPAVTGACLMLDTALYRQLGGLSGIYVQGDFEDSDLCLRLSYAGYVNWYLPRVVLHHLEGQSYPGAVRHFNTRYNHWLHTRLWGAHIESVMADFAQVAPEDRPEATSRDGTEAPASLVPEKVVAL
jgi:GT2 family glycosyltransferase